MKTRIQQEQTEITETGKEISVTSVTSCSKLFYERIYAFLRRLAGNEADAADLTQRTFGRLWQALPTFARRSSVSSWIHGIAYHVYVDWRRAEHRSEARPEAWWAACRAPDAAPLDSLCRSSWPYR